ncbi:cytidylyltransferase domain-containing protein [Kiloniella antarctica]|uniref:Cytidylyltransferase domain-containing protein n=1 Tax=Kiloniella antarctica TaxID=1550907 RepID=A0ABW5BMK4_9PROT
MRRLAIIPARGGSKRIPKKNIRDFCGKPMIGHILETAQDSGLFNVIHVSTDCEEVNAVASELGFKPDFSRPSELADDYTPLIPVLRFVVNAYQKRGQEFDQVWMFFPCAPLISIQDLRGIQRLFDAHGGRCSVITVGAYAAPIERGYKRSDDGALTPLNPEKFTVRTQDLSETYFEAGACAVFSATRILGSEGYGSNLDYVGYILPKSKAIDIDDDDDWKVAEAIFLGMHKAGKS